MTASRQGIQRGITAGGVIAIELVRVMTLELGMTYAGAVAVAREVLRDPPKSSEIRTPSGLTIRFPIDDIELRLRARISDALEAVPRRRRGRPPGPKKNAGR